MLWGGAQKLPLRLGVHITAGDTPITDEAVLVKGKLPRNVLYIVGLNMAAERCRFCYSFPLPFPHIRGYGEDNECMARFGRRTTRRRLLATRSPCFAPLFGRAKTS